VSFFDYSSTVLEHYDNPRNVGEAVGENATAIVESPDCGDRLRLSLRVGGDGRIQEARFRTFGCVAAIAASSMTTELLVGLELLEARSITDRRVAEALGGLPERKQHCSVLAEEAIHAALENYESTRGDSRRVPAPEETSR
jgi:nitrogen fixation NifU-like protein